MATSYFYILLLARKEQELEVDHVVDDGVMSAKHADIARPRKECSHVRVEEGGKAIGCSQKHRLVVFIVGGFVALEETAYHLKSQIVVEDGTVSKVFKFKGISTSLRRVAGHP